MQESSFRPQETNEIYPMSYTINNCIAHRQLSFGKWYSPNGKKPNEFTYCEWCVNNGCVDIKDVYDVGVVKGCNCDCANRRTHIPLEKYLCDEHKKGGGIMLSIMGTCTMPNCGVYTPHRSNKYCFGCSAIFAVCEVCGKK